MSKPILAAILSVAGTSLTDEERFILEKYNPVGIALFGRNIQSKPQLKSLIKSQMEKQFTRKLVASDEQRITQIKHSAEKAVMLLNGLIGQGKRYGINFTYNGLEDALRSPETIFSKELAETPLKTDAFVNQCRNAFREVSGSMEFIILENDTAKLDTEKLESYFDSQLRFFIEDESMQADFENTIAYGKMILSARRFTQSNKFAFLAVKNVAPEIVQTLALSLQS